MNPPCRLFPLIRPPTKLETPDERLLLREVLSLGASLQQQSFYFILTQNHNQSFSKKKGNQHHKHKQHGSEDLPWVRYRFGKAPGKRLTMPGLDQRFLALGVLLRLLAAPAGGMKK